MLLFAYIMFVLATAPALKVARVTALSVVSFQKQGEWHLDLLAGCWTWSQQSWVPSCLGCRDLPLPEVPLAEPAKHFSSLIALFIIYLLVCVPVVGQTPSPCLATSGIHNIYLRGSSHIPGLSSHLAVHPDPTALAHIPGGLQASLLPPRSSVAAAICLLVSPFPF